MKVNNFKIGRMIGSERTGGAHWVGLIAMIVTSLLVSYSDAVCDKCITCQGSSDPDGTAVTAITTALAGLVTDELTDPVVYTAVTNYDQLKAHFGNDCENVVEDAATVGDTKCVSMVVNNNGASSPGDKFSCQIRAPMSDLYNGDSLNDATAFAEELDGIDDTAMTEALEAVVPVTAAVFLCNGDNCNNEETTIEDDTIVVTATCEDTKTLCETLADAVETSLTDEENPPVTELTVGDVDSEVGDENNEIEREVVYTFSAPHKWFADQAAVVLFFNGITEAEDADFEDVEDANVQITPAELPTTTTTTTSTTTTEATTTEEPVIQRVTVEVTFTSGVTDEDEADAFCIALCAEMVAQDNCDSCSHVLRYASTRRARRQATIEGADITVDGPFGSDDTVVENLFNDAKSTVEGTGDHNVNMNSVVADNIADFAPAPVENSAIGVSAFGLVNMIAIIVPIFAYCSFWRQ